MAEADSVPTAIQAPITGTVSNQRVPTYALGYTTAVLLLGWFPWNALLILLLFLCRSFRSGSFS